MYILGDIYDTIFSTSKVVVAVGVISFFNFCVVEWRVIFSVARRGEARPSSEVVSSQKEGEGVTDTYGWKCLPPSTTSLNGIPPRI